MAIGSIRLILFSLHSIFQTVLFISSMLWKITFFICLLAIVVLLLLFKLCCLSSYLLSFSFVFYASGFGCRMFFIHFQHSNGSFFIRCYICLLKLNNMYNVYVYYIYNKIYVTCECCVCVRAFAIVFVML